LRRGRERSLQHGHPWLFSGAIESVEGDPAPGATVDIVDSDNRWLAQAAFAPSSRIACRVWTFDRDQVVDESLIGQRLRAALGRRSGLAENGEIDAYREVNAESDLLPGVIVDRYGDVRVIQLLTPGAEQFRGELAQSLRTGCRAIFERSDNDARRLEALPPSRGPLWGEIPPGPIPIHEYGLTFLVDVAEGHKTGFYLDQRENRRLSAEILGSGDVLDAFCYTGGFTVAALRGGAARVLSIDSSQRALEGAAANLAANGLDADRSERLAGMSLSSCAGCGPGSVLTPSCWTRPASLRPQLKCRAPRAATRTSTCWPSSCFAQVAG
jgi:23S rRNA (cytosine1962-C5)-methyltransferase